MGSKPPRVLAVYAIDPGGTSGVARGTFDMSAETVRDVMLSEDTWWETWETAGTPDEQADEIFGEFQDWYGQLVERGWYLPDIDLVCESFQLRPKRMSDPRVLYPVRIGERVELMARQRGHRMEYQTPSQALGYATSKRLKEWQAFERLKGTDHRRDALRHAVFRVHKRLT